MKTQQNLTELSDKINQELQSQHQKNLNEQATFLGNQKGRNNLPGAEETNCESHYEKLRAVYLQMYHEIERKLNGRQQLLLGSMELQNINGKLTVAGEQQENIQRHQNGLKDDQARLGFERKSLWDRIKLGLLFTLIAICDTSNMTAAFLYLVRDYVWAAIAGGIIVGLCVLMLLKTAVVSYRDSNNRNLKRAILYIVIPILIFTAVFFGILRSVQVRHDGGVNSIITILIFITVQFVLLLCTAFCIYLYVPTAGEQANQKTYYRLQASIKKDDKGLVKLKKIIEEMQTQKTTIGLYRLELRTMQLHFIGVLQAMYREAVACFIEANLRSRNDRAYPPGFHNRPLPLELIVEDEKIIPEINTAS